MAAALEVSSILGPIVAGVVLNAFIFGICIMQLSIYFTCGFKDRLGVRLVVYWSVLLDTFHTISSTYLLWIYVVDNFTNPAILAAVPWPIPSTPIITALTSVPIQHFLAWRIKRWSSSNLIFTCLSILSLTQGALGIIGSSYVLAQSHFSITDFYKFIPIVDAWNTILVVCDLCTTYFLAKYWKQCHMEDHRQLQSNRHTTSYYATQNSKDSGGAIDNIFTRFMLQFIETAAFPLIFCIMDFVTFTVLKNTSYHLIFAIPLGRIYTNTLLTTLNNRDATDQSLGGTILDTPIHLPTLSTSGNDSRYSLPHDPESCTGIKGLSRPEGALVLPVEKDILLRRS